jgi:polar amino acid transport system substrate-binding protein
MAPRPETCISGVAPSHLAALSACVYQAVVAGNSAEPGGYYCVTTRLRCNLARVKVRMTTVHAVFRWFCLALLISLPLASASAQSLDAILKAGKIRIGIDMNIPPFGFADENQQPSGSEVETAKLLAHDLGVELEIVPTTAANRIAYLLTSRADLMMATFAVSSERAKAVWFSSPYGASGAQLLAPKSTAIKSVADLAGKSVAVARGSLTDQSLSVDAPPTVRVMRFDDDAAATAAMMAGQVDALGTATPVAATLLRRFPGRDLESKFTIRTSWYSIGLRRGDVDMLQWLNTFIFLHVQNGDLAKIYEKWVGVPLPAVPSF